MATKTMEERNTYALKSVLVFFLYGTVAYLAHAFVPNPITLYPAFAVGVCALFFVGLEMWPAVYFSSLIISVLNTATPVTLLVMPVAQVLQAAAGAYLLKQAKIDPLFRRSRDILSLFLIVAFISLIVPTTSLIVSAINAAFFGSVPSPISWGARYTATVFCFLILVPLFLRWFAKPRFKRTLLEAFETIVVLGLIILIDVPLFIFGIPAVGSIPLPYLLLIPFLWIALRLRPRFTTLALTITSVIAIGGLYTAPDLTTAAFNARLFNTEILLIVLAGIFLIITALEENRRLNANLLRTQVATLENAIWRVSSESSAKNDFIAVLAHELRNPLAPLASAIDFLKLKEDRPEDEKEMLTLMHDRMNVVRRLLDDLLEVSRISEGKLDLKKEVISIEAVVRRAVLSTMHQFKERHQSLLTHGAKEAVYVEGDPVRLEQVFSNLLVNASKYSSTGDTVELSIEATEDSVAVIVKDEGIGIEQDALEHIFTPFYQVASTPEGKRGLGIGLALVRGFVEMHSGTIEVASAGKGYGSEFIVRLPRVLGGSATEETHVPEEVKSHSTRLRVLVVDDNDSAAWGMSKLLELRGCRVDFAYDGAQTIEKAARFKPDIILLDISLPDQDGYTVAKILRTQGYEGRIIGLTGYSSEDARAKGLHAGFNDYLVKPAGLAELSIAIPEIA